MQETESTVSNNLPLCTTASQSCVERGYSAVTVSISTRTILYCIWSLLNWFSKYACVAIHRLVYSVSIFGLFLFYVSVIYAVIKSDTDTATVYLLYLMFARYILSLFHKCQSIDGIEYVLPRCFFRERPKKWLQYVHFKIWVTSWKKKLFMPNPKNKGADHVVRRLDSTCIIPLLA